MGGRSDELPTIERRMIGGVLSSTAVVFLRKWYLNALWYEVYDILEHLLAQVPSRKEHQRCKRHAKPRRGLLTDVPGSGIVPHYI